jgi:hypothetical protein
MVACLVCAGMVDCDGLFWSKAMQAGLLVVFLKRLSGASFDPFHA